MTDTSTTPTAGDAGARNCGQIDHWRQVLYRESLDFARNEIIAIWLRYSAVLLIQVLFVKQLADAYPDHGGWLVDLLALLGILLSVLWYLLNLGGWVNQDLHLRRADQALPSEIKAMDELYKNASPTYFWKDDRKTVRGGPIYWCAQALPIVFAIAYAAVFLQPWHRIVEMDCIALLKGVLVLVILSATLWLRFRINCDLVSKSPL